MRNVLESMLNHIKAFFARLTKRERLRFGIIAGSIVLLAVVLAFLLNRTTYEILYEGLPAGQAGKVLEVLDGMEVPYRTQGGDTILVPSGMVTDLTMRLATTDTLRTDGFDPYIYSGLVNNMTTTEQDRRVYLQYTIGEFLKQVFVRNPNIEDALVMITLPERSVYMLQNKQVPSASIQLKVAGNRKLTFDEVRGITEYVKGAVSDIAEDHIKITDTNYNYYNVQERSITEDMNMQLAFKQDAQNVIQEQVNTVLTPIFGFSGFMAVVNADLNFDEVSTSSTEWAPPVAGMTEGLAVSASKLLEIVRPGFETGDIPGTDSNGLGSVEYPYGNITSDEDYLRALDERNYELNEFHTEVTQARGAVERLTVAVTIDANLVPDDYTSEVKALVVGATGAAAKDVTVMRLPFLENTDAVKALELNESIEAKRRSQELLRLILVLVCILAAVILLAVMLVSIARIYNRRMEEEAKALSAQLSAEAMAARAVAGQYDYPVGATMDILIGDDDEYAELDSNGIPIRPIDPSGKSELLRELEGFIERDPAAAVTMLRNWLTEE